MKKIFTLVELLVVVAIICILAAVLLPSLEKAQRVAVKVQCISNLKSCGVAMEQYTSSYKDYYPWIGSPTTPTIGYRVDANFAQTDTSGWVQDDWRDTQVLLNEVIKGNRTGDHKLWSKMFFCPGVSFNTGNLFPGIAFNHRIYSTYGGYGWAKTLNIKHPSKKVAGMDFANAYGIWTSNGPGYGCQTSTAVTSWGGAVPGGGLVLNTEWSDEGKTLDFYYGRHGSTVNILFLDGHVGNILGRTAAMDYYQAKRANGTAATNAKDASNNMFNAVGNP